MDEMTREQHAERIMAQVMSRVGSLTELSKVALMASDGGKAGALSNMAVAIAEGGIQRQELCRFLAVMIVDRAVKELESP